MKTSKTLFSIAVSVFFAAFYLLSLKSAVAQNRHRNNYGLGMDLIWYCSHRHGNSARLVLRENNAYGWKCEVAGRDLDIDVGDVCRIMYGSTYQAVMGNFNDSHSWYCSNSSTVSNNQINGLEVFDEAMIRFMQERSIPSGTLAVMKDGQLLFSKGYGYLNYQQNQATSPDTLMRIASLSKPITNAAIKRLITEGRLNPNSSVFQLLEIAPASGTLGDPRLRDVTVQHLLEHRGGWDSASTFDPMFMSVEIANELGINRPANCADTIAFMLSQPLQFTPGTRSSYSNFGYCVLGRVIENVTGQSYIDYVKGSILSPIGVQDVYLANTLPNQRHPREVQWYSDPGRGPSVFLPNQIVPYPDGAFYIEAMDSHGGLIASSTALARFAQTYGCDGEPFTSGQTWICFGSLSGTFSMLLWRPNGVTIAVLFNQRTDSSGLNYDDISRIMDSAASTIQW